MVLGDHNSNHHPLLKFLLESGNYQQSRGDTLPIAHGGNIVWVHKNQNAVMTREHRLPLFRRFWGEDNCRWWQRPWASRPLLLSPGKASELIRAGMSLLIITHCHHYPARPARLSPPAQLSTTALFASCLFISSLLQSTTKKKSHRSG